jgi:hypothetical protein
MEETMLAKISRMMDRWASGRLILALIAVFVIFESITLPILQRSPGGEIEPLDAIFFYTPQEAFSTIGLYGDARSFWIGAYLSWDIVNPILYTLIVSLAMSWVFQRSFGPAGLIGRLNVLPFGAGLFDVLENVSIVIMMTTYPARHDFIARLAAICTVSKVGILGVSTLLILIGLIMAATSRLRERAI